MTNEKPVDLYRCAVCSKLRFEQEWKEQNKMNCKCGSNRVCPVSATRWLAIRWIFAQKWSLFRKLKEVFQVEFVKA